MTAPKPAARVHAEKPILFSAAMVRAILDGRKTQTRRIVKDQSLHRDDGDIWTGFLGWQPIDWALTNPGACGKGCLPRWSVGDRLWVRETWSPEHQWTGTKRSEIPNGDDIWYWADGNPDYGDWTSPKPSIFMPRWASRITLEVTDVRVQRLQDISEEDAIAEGAQKPMHICEDDDCSYRAGFEQVWEQINGAGSWGANPFVVALTFRRIA